MLTFGSLLESPPACAPCADMCCDGYDADHAAEMADAAGDVVLIERLTYSPAGPALVAVLAGVDPSQLNDVECVAYAQAVVRQQSWTDSLLTLVAARFVEHRPGPTREEAARVPGGEKRVQLGGELTAACGSFTAAEWGAATGTSTWAAARLLGDSLDLDVRLPGIRAAMRVGLCDLPTARLVASRTRDLSAATAALVEEAVLGLLPGLTRTQLERVIDSVAATTEPGVLEQRAQQVRDRREVWIQPTNDDHAEIAGTLATPDAHRLDIRLDELARLLGILQRAGVPGWGPTDRTRETIQQRRARALGLLADPDTITTLVAAARAITHPHTSATDTATETATETTTTGATAAGGTAAGGTGAGGTGAGGCVRGCTGTGTGSGLRPTTVYVHVRPDGTTDLEGHGVLSVPTVKDLIDTTTVTVRPVIDLNEPVGSTGYTPSDAVDETVTLRNPTCVFPYCQRPSRHCQADHTVPWPHGPTCSCNLGPLCQHHHHVKTHGAWTLIQTSAGVFRWRSPTDDIYIVDPQITRRL